MATLKTAQNKAWATFSKWIRNRDKRCVCCGSYDNLQAGHFWHNVLDFDEININTQCARCNHYLSGNLGVYSLYLIRKYGLKAFEDLEIRHYMAMKGEKRSIQDYEALTAKYQLSTGE